MSTARQVLLDKVLGHVANNGLGDLSLRELATATGTSHRMILYHFGNREGLIAAIVEAMELHQQDALVNLATHATTPRELLTLQWRQLSQPTMRPFVVLFFEVLAMALQQRPGTEHLLETLTAPWLSRAGEIADDLQTQVSTVDLLLGIAVVRGLLLEATASGDYDASTAAFERFLDMWDVQAHREVAN